MDRSILRQSDQAVLCRSGAQLQAPVGPTKRSPRFRRKQIWARVCSAGVCATVLATPGVWAEGADKPAAVPSRANEFKLACSRSFEQSQRLRNSSQYLAAVEEVVKCADPKCGPALFDECTKIYDQLQTAIPTVVFAARDDSGTELTGVVVSIDGVPSRDQLDGKPVRVDPGSHQFAFSSDGHESSEQSVLIRTGEQFRPINAVLPRVGSAGKSAELPPSQGPSSNGASARKIPLASYVLGGASVVGLGAFIGFRLAASSRFDSLEHECKPSCAQSEVDSVRQKYVISDVALGVGLAAAAAAVTVYFASPHESRPAAALRLSPSERGLSASFARQF